MDMEVRKQIDNFFDEDGWDEGHSSYNVWSREQYDDLDFMCGKMALWAKLEKEYSPSMIKDSDWYHVPFDMFDCAGKRVRQSDRFLLELLKAYDLKPSAAHDDMKNSVYFHAMTKVICFLNLMDKPEIKERLQTSEFIEKIAQEETICSILDEINRMDIRAHVNVYEKENPWLLSPLPLYKNPEEYPQMISELCAKIDDYRSDLGLPAPERIEGLPEFNKKTAEDMESKFSSRNEPNEEDVFLEEKNTWSREQCNDVDFMCSQMSHWEELERKNSYKSWEWYDMPGEMFAMAGADVKKSDAFLIASLRAFVIDSSRENMSVPNEISIGRHLKIMDFLRTLDTPEVQERLFSPDFLSKISQDETICSILYEISSMDSASETLLSYQLLSDERSLYDYDDPAVLSPSISLDNIPESAGYVSALHHTVEEYRQEPQKAYERKTRMNDFESFMYKALKECDINNSSNEKKKPQMQFINLLKVLENKTGKDFGWYFNTRITEKAWRNPFRKEKKTENKNSANKPYFQRKREKKR